MSLFDVIRHPISVPPTREELEGLPDGVLNIWAYSVVSRIFCTKEGAEIGYQAVRNDPALMADVIKNRWDISEKENNSIRGMVQELREILNDMENIIRP